MILKLSFRKNWLILIQKKKQNSPKFSKINKNYRKKRFFFAVKNKYYLPQILWKILNLNFKFVNKSKKK